jgi:dCTP deaminase
MITPFNCEQLNPASYDVTVGGKYIYDGVCMPADITDDGLLLQPNDFVLLHTVERFKLPPTTAAQFALKSSRAREGFEHSMAGFCDPSWEGTLTMEIVNVSKHDLVIMKGMRIGQMVFFKMDAPPMKPYSGRYQGKDGVNPSDWR